MRTSKLSDPLGKIVARKRIGAYVFVQHTYPELAERQRHSHPWLHLSIVQRGQYMRGVGAHITYHKPGTVALLATNENHTDGYSPGSRCLHLVIPSDIERQLTREFAQERGTPKELTHLVSATASVALYREFQRPDSDSPLVVEGLLLDLVSRELGIKAERSFYRPPWIGAVLDYLDDTFDEPWSLRKIAEEIGVHPVYLCRAFSEHMGFTFGQYVRKLRVLRGWQLLSLGQYERLADIAAECGFADESHFVRAFKKQFGASPRRYRPDRNG